MSTNIKIDNDNGSNKISLKQNASGFWYVNDITVNCVSIMDGIEIMSGAIDRINSILEDKNKKFGKVKDKNERQKL